MYVTLEELEKWSLFSTDRNFSLSLLRWQLVAPNWIILEDHQNSALFRHR
jgi:hypothetical protein